MIAPARVSCCVPFCHRTTGNAFGEWICGDHWRMVSQRTKRRRRVADRILARSRERFDTAYIAQGGFHPAQHSRVLAAQRLSQALWDRCKAEAIERAAGVQ